MGEDDEFEMVHRGEAEFDKMDGVRGRLPPFPRTGNGNVRSMLVSPFLRDAGRLCVIWIRISRSTASLATSCTVVSHDLPQPRSFKGNSSEYAELITRQHPTQQPRNPPLLQSLPDEWLNNFDCRSKRQDKGVKWVRLSV
jgi:hypothetical protein